MLLYVIYINETIAGIKFHSFSLRIAIVIRKGV